MKRDEIKNKLVLNGLYKLLLYKLVINGLNSRLYIAEEWIKEMEERNIEERNTQGTYGINCKGLICKELSPREGKERRSSTRAMFNKIVDVYFAKWLENMELQLRNFYKSQAGYSNARKTTGHYIIQSCLKPEKHKKIFPFIGVKEGKILYLQRSCNNTHG